MAKKEKEVRPEPEVVWSEKYGCNISKANAYYSEEEKSWLNEFIEKNRKK